MSSATPKHGWIAWFAQNPVAANLLMAGILVLGLMTAFNMRTEGFPEPAPRTINIEASFQGASARDVENGAAIKVEQALNGLEGIKEISTKVTSSAATIAVTSVDGYDLYVLKDNIQARVDAINSFPAQLDTITVTPAQDIDHVISAQITGDVDHRVLKETARSIRESFLSLPEISSVTTEGALPYEITVELRRDRLRAFGLQLDEVAEALQNQSISLSAGQLETDRGTITLQTRNQAYYGAELERTVLRSSAQGGLVRLGDVATIVDGFAEDALISVFNGRPSIRLDVQLTGRDSIINAAAAVEAKVEDIRASGSLPHGVTLEFWEDEAEETRARLGLMLENAAVGMALVFVMLTLFLDIRLAAWVALGIPISFAGALFVMGPTYFDYSINDLTSFAFIIVLGIVVDDAIVIGESIYAHKEQGDEGVATAIRGASAVATPATFGVLTTVAAFYPLTTVSSDFGGSFSIIATVVILCLLFSLMESKLILPAHLGRLDVRKGRAGQGIAMRALGRVQQAVNDGLKWGVRRLYLPGLRLAVSNLLATFLLCLAVFFGALGLVTHGIVKTEFFPDRDVSLVYLDITLESGTSPNKTRAVAAHYGKSLVAANAEFVDLHNLSTHLVRNSYVSSTQAEQVVFTVELLGGTERSFPASDFLNHWRAITDLPPEVTQLNFYGDFGENEDLSIELVADDEAVARQAMEKLTEEMRKIVGVNDVITNLDTTVSELTFHLTPLGERLGLSNLALITQLRNSVFGFEAQTIQRGVEEVALKVRFPKDERNSLSDLDDMRIALPDGGQVALTSVANVTVHDVPQEYTRNNGQRVLTVTAKVDEAEASQDTILEELEARVFPILAQAFPQVPLKVRGEAEQEGNATAELAAGLVFALAAIYALLAIPLKSYTLPLVIMTAIPFGVVGAIFGHLFIGIPVSLLSFFGILALSGVVVNDALVLTSRYTGNRANGMGYRDAILEAAPARFRAILLTSATTFAGLAPLVWETSEHAQILVPMAVSLSFGLLFATVITLIIIPVLLGLHHAAARWFGATAKAHVPPSSQDHSREARS